MVDQWLRGTNQTLLPLSCRSGQSGTELDYRFWEDVSSSDSSQSNNETPHRSSASETYSTGSGFSSISTGSGRFCIVIAHCPEEHTLLETVYVAFRTGIKAESTYQAVTGCRLSNRLERAHGSPSLSERTRTDYHFSESNALWTVGIGSSHRYR